MVLSPHVRGFIERNDSGEARTRALSPHVRGFIESIRIACTRRCLIPARAGIYRIARSEARLSRALSPRVRGFITTFAFGRPRWSGPPSPRMRGFIATTMIVIMVTILVVTVPADAGIYRLSGFSPQNASSPSPHVRGFILNELISKGSLMEGLIPARAGIYR